MATDTEIQGLMDAAFGGVSKPEHFVNDYRHCEECTEHDDLLRAHDRESLQLKHVNNPCWDPICFCSPEGMAYYMPTLVRFALLPLADEHVNFDWYGHQLLFHLSYKETENRLLKCWNAQQRQAVASLLAHLVESRSAEIQVLDNADEYRQAHELWSQAA
jgi:hypothetical protein